jgi:cobalt-zinc-cadmium efflux system membrane fusion protein
MLMACRLLKRAFAHSGSRPLGARHLWLVALTLGSLCFAATESPAQTPLRTSQTVRISAERMHRLSIVDVELCSFPSRKSAIGQIAFNEDASTAVLAPFSGRVTRLIAKVGDEVKRGDPLFEIDSPEVVLAQTDLIAAVQGLEKGRSQMALALSIVERQAGLYAVKATSERELEQAQTDRASAQTDVRTAEGILAAARNRLRILGRSEAEVERVERERSIDPLITVTAPIAGTVIARKIGPGQYVRSDSGDQLYAIADLTTMWVKASVPESDIPFVRIGQEIEVGVAAIPGRSFMARVIAIGAATDPVTRRVPVRSEIPNPDGVLKSEMFATFQIATGHGDLAPSVVTEAVMRDGDGATVWVERAPMLFERRRVSLGLEDGGRVEVREGLKPGERVVGRGALLLDK